MPAGGRAVRPPLGASDTPGGAPDAEIAPPNPWLWRNRRDRAQPFRQFAPTCPDADAAVPSDISAERRESPAAARSAPGYVWWRSTESRRRPCAAPRRGGEYSAFPPGYSRRAK